VAKLYSKGSAAGAEESADRLLSIIDAFLALCRQPAALEFGENAIPLVKGEFALETRSGRLNIEIWSENRSISRRILAVERQSTGILDCVIQRFGGKPGRLSFLDLARPQTAHRSLTGTRRNFAGQFRNMVTRQFPGWQLDALTVAQDLRRSFSGVYPRARLSRSSHVIAAMACAQPEAEAQMLTFALLWHAHLRRSAETGQRVSLALFLPEGTGNLTAQRLQWLDAGKLGPAIYLFNQHGSAGQVDPQDLGNLDTRVASKLARNGEFTSGISIDAAAGCTPERWLETVVRANITRIDPQLLAQPVHSQVLTFAAADRDLIDLLAVTRGGRLSVLELKASEDLHLPLQALDYWMRVTWHARRGELTQLFPKTPLRADPPHLILLAPAMAFHSTNAEVIWYFSPEIDVERVGVNTDWRKNFRVVLRLKGSAAPASHS
jgi:hypothetical protein